MKDLWGKALDIAVPETYTHLSDEQLERVQVVFANLVIDACAEHILATSDRYRKEYFANKVRELKT